MKIIQLLNHFFQNIIRKTHKTKNNTTTEETHPHTNTPTQR